MTPSTEAISTEKPTTPLSTDSIGTPVSVVLLNADTRQATSRVRPSWRTNIQNQTCVVSSLRDSARRATVTGHLRA
jgi:hypothetical protein